MPRGMPNPPSEVGLGELRRLSSSDDISEKINTVTNLGEFREGN